MRVFLSCDILCIVCHIVVKNADFYAVRHRSVFWLLTHCCLASMCYPLRCGPFQSVPNVVSVVSFLQFGYTPLLWAAWNGHSEVVSLLLERGADKEARDTKVSTPSCWAIVTNEWGSVGLGHSLSGLGLLLDHSVWPVWIGDYNYYFP